MLKIDIDLSSLGNINKMLAPDYKAIGQQMDLVGGLVANTWESAAYGVTLPGMTRALRWPAYADTIQHHLRGELEVVVTGDPKMTAEAQQSHNAWDMKPGLLSGPHAKTGKNGVRYNTIPFRHKFTDLSDQAVAALVGNVKNFVSAWGQRSKILPAGSFAHQNAQGQYSKTGNPVAAERYTWKTGLESGIRLSMENGPITFRRVSDNSDPASWWYPARVENPILDAVWASVKDDVEEWIYGAWIDALFGGE